MTTRTWNSRSVLGVALLSLCLAGAAGPASAVPPTLNTSGLSPAQCYRKDSDCTQFCGAVTNPDYRYDCFAICDRMLDRCLATGDWTDSKIEPTSGETVVKGELTGRLLRMLVILSDADGDGAVSAEEMRSVQGKTFSGPAAEVDGPPPRKK